MSEMLEPLPRGMTREAYYAWAEAQPRGRTELVDGEVVAMAAERVAHARAKARAWRALDEALSAAGAPCEALIDGVAVEVGEATAYEPDVVVNCGERVSGDAFAAPFPLIIVEVTSPSNSRVDMTTKATDYLRLPSLRHYIIIHLAKRVILHHRKLEDGRIETAILAGGALVLDPPGITLSVEALLAEV
jgi:Uma2 family endonuclease